MQKYNRMKCTAFLVIASKLWDVKQYIKLHVMSVSIVNKEQKRNNSKEIHMKYKGDDKIL